MPNTTSWVIGDSRNYAPQLKEMNRRALETKVGKLAMKRDCTIATIFAEAYLNAGRTLHEGSAAFGLFYESLRAGNTIEISSLVQKYCDETWHNQIICAQCGAGFDYPVRFVIQPARGSAPIYYCSYECHQKASPDGLSPKMMKILGLSLSEQGRPRPSLTAVNGSTGPPTHIVRTDPEVDPKPRSTGDDDMARARTTPGAPLKTGDQPLDMVLRQARSALDEARKVAEAAILEAVEIGRKAVLTARSQAEVELSKLPAQLDAELRGKFGAEFARLEACHAALVVERQSVAQTREAIDTTLRRLEDREQELGATLASVKEAEAERARQFTNALAKLEEPRVSASTPASIPDAVAQVAQPPALERKKRGRPSKRLQQPAEEARETAPPLEQTEPAEAKPIEQPSPDGEDLGNGWTLKRIRALTPATAKKQLFLKLTSQVRKLIEMRSKGKEV